MNSDKTRESPRWVEKCSALETAFRKLQLPRSIEGVKGIPYETLIPGIPRQLMLMAPWQCRRNILSPKQALRQLDDTSARLVDLMDRLPPIVVEALNFRQRALSDLKTKLRILNCAAKSTKVPPSRGAPRKIQARKVAVAVAQHYYGLTSKKPTVPKDKNERPYGPFLNLMTAVFEILEVNASALSQAEYVTRNWRSLMSSGIRKK
jgi:hypothetical protein